MYRFLAVPEAEDQIAALPDKALEPFAELITVLEISPWSGRPFSRSKPEGNMRTMDFGGHGFAVYVVLEDQREVHLVRLVWL